MSEHYDIISGAERQINVRLLQRGDLAALIDMHRQLSTQTLAMRYLVPRQPSMEELAQVCALNDMGRGGAFVAVAADEIVAIAYYVRVGWRAAEPAVVVADSFQRQGIGRQLLGYLLEHALRHGIRTFTTVVYPENRAVLGLIRASGLPYEMAPSRGARLVNVCLTDVDRDRLIRVASEASARAANPAIESTSLVAEER